MILEVATINVVSGKEGQFEAAFAEARKLLDGVNGFIDLDLKRGIEHPSRYVLLAHWNTVEDHTEGFRDSPAFARWRELIGPFFDSPPEVAHFRPVP